MASAAGSGTDYTIFKRHAIFLFHAAARFVFFLVIAGIIAGFSRMFRADIPENVLYGVLFPVVFLTVNYAFFRFILAIVKYENKLIILLDDQMIIINATLILQDDIEVMNLYWIMKFDVECHGILANVLGFGTIIVEQQKNDVRSFHFMPQPYRMLRIFNDHLRKMENYRERNKALLREEAITEKKKNPA